MKKKIRVRVEDTYGTSAEAHCSKVGKLTVHAWILAVLLKKQPSVDPPAARGEGFWGTHSAGLGLFLSNIQPQTNARG